MQPVRAVEHFVERASHSTLEVTFAAWVADRAEHLVAGGQVGRPTEQIAQRVALDESMAEDQRGPQTRLVEQAQDTLARQVRCHPFASLRDRRQKVLVDSRAQNSTTAAAMVAVALRMGPMAAENTGAHILFLLPVPSLFPSDDRSPVLLVHQVMVHGTVPEETRQIDEVGSWMIAQAAKLRVPLTQHTRSRTVARIVQACLCGQFALPSRHT